MSLISHRILVGHRLEQVEILHLDAEAGGDVVEGEVIVLPFPLDLLADGQAQVPIARLDTHAPVDVAGHGGRDPGREDVLDNMIPVEMADSHLETLFFFHDGRTDVARQRKMETGLGLIDGLRGQFGGRTGNPVDERAEPALLRPRRREQHNGRGKGKEESVKSHLASVGNRQIYGFFPKGTKKRLPAWQSFSCGPIHPPPLPRRPPRGVFQRLGRFAAEGFITI